MGERDLHNITQAGVTVFINRETTMRLRPSEEQQQGGGEHKYTHLSSRPQSSRGNGTPPLSENGGR